MLEWKRCGFSDARIAALRGVTEASVRGRRVALAFARCSSESTHVRLSSRRSPYLYSTYEQHCEAEPSDRKKVVILGSGPNRIGQGIEFDYCCVHGVLALAEAGHETIMVNCNPETVSTDYDTSDRLYFEPLTLESVRDPRHREAGWGRPAVWRTDALEVGDGA